MKLTRAIARVRARGFILEMLNNCQEKELKASLIVSKLWDKFLEEYKDDDEAINLLYNYLEAKYKSGESVFNNNMFWQMTDLSLGYAGFIDNGTNNAWGFRSITELGKKFLSDFKTSQQNDFEYFNNNSIYAWLQKNASEQWAKSKFNKNIKVFENDLGETDRTEIDTPEEIKRENYNNEDAITEILRETIAKLGDGYSKVAKGRKIEILVKEVFDAMGYSCIRTDPSSRLKLKDGSGDGGIDMLVSKQEFGLNRIPVQVKGYTEKNLISTKEISDFAWAINKVDKKEGIFVATTTFAIEAQKEALRRNISLIDIDKLVSLMIKYEIGVSMYNHYTKNSNYFENL